MLPTALLALVLPAAVVQAQFTYPPPLERPLTDYTSGLVQSPLNFSEGDSVYGGWFTPGKLKSYMLYRCTHTPSSTPIRPSNSTFVDREGRVSKSGDGTWEQMPHIEGGYTSSFTTGFNPGRNPIWFSGDLFAPNATTGNLCWFELYPGTEGWDNPPEAFDMTEGGKLNGGYVRTVVVDGASEWYFATVPFEVHPRRPSGLTVTWWKGKPKPNSPNDTRSDMLAAFAREFPEYVTDKKSAAAGYAGASGVAALLWTVGLALVVAMN
ncbi:hypothetical protein PG993_005492 [Apiospora rasikravindrae]|uniref:Uncharacterized protein n=1 Tax=Apiospora rasikravindrae TaxID=990691 RepID=A0ABR1TIG3_9PEZI